MDETRNKVTILSSLPVPVQVPSPQPLRMSLALPDQAEVPTVRFFFEPLFDSDFFFEPEKQLGSPLLDFMKTQKQQLYKTKGNTPAKPKLG